MDEKRKQYQREIERGLKLQITPELASSDTLRRVWMAAHHEQRSVEALVADGLMAAVEAAEDVLSE
jgi:hypothetical protein